MIKLMIVIAQKSLVHNFSFFVQLPLFRRAGIHSFGDHASGKLNYVDSYLREYVINFTKNHNVCVNINEINPLNHIHQ